MKNKVGHLKLLRVKLRALVLVRRVAGFVLIAVGVAALVAALPVETVKAASPDTSANSSIMDDCLSCHIAKVPDPAIEQIEPLSLHDQLGSGNKACTVCHSMDDKHLGSLVLRDGTQIPFSDAPKLCGQCHQKRYDQWLQGIHGVPHWSEGIPGMGTAQNKTAWPAGQYNWNNVVGQNNTAPVLDQILKELPNFLGGEKKACTVCHNPHHPAIVLSSVIKPHPVAAPAPPPAPVTPFVVLGGGLLLAIGIGAAIGRRQG